MKKNLEDGTGTKPKSYYDAFFFPENKEKMKKILTSIKEVPAHIKLNAENIDINYQKIFNKL